MSSDQLQSEACSTSLLTHAADYRPAVLFPARAADVIEDGAPDLLSTHQEAPPKVCPTTSHILATASEHDCTGLDIMTST